MGTLAIRLVQSRCIRSAAVFAQLNRHYITRWIDRIRTLSATMEIVDYLAVDVSKNPL